MIYSFQGTTADGANPHRGVLLTKNGDLYGTTVYGGTAGQGSVFQLVPGTSGWTENVLHFFADNTTDAGEPDGDLIMVGNNIYSTAAVGGAHNAGNVYEEKNAGGGAWTYSALYNFGAKSEDGSGPYAGLIYNAGVYYGTTFNGGKSNNGTVFSLTLSGTTWVEKVLYRFGGQPGDGANPHATLLYAGNNTYYGTTYNGGSSGKGTIYQLVESSGVWTEKVIYNLGGGSDGTNPHSPVIMDSAGNLYGTTVLGGSHNKGTVYTLTPGTGGAWTHTVLYNFGSAAKDGSVPRAGVVFGDTQSILYGATTTGGNSTNCSGGCGTVYQLNVSGSSATEQILYNFTGSPDGNDPYADLVYTGGLIYGTTYNGGSSANCTGGCGSVFILKP